MSLYQSIFYNLDTKMKLFYLFECQNVISLKKIHPQTYAASLFSSKNMCDRVRATTSYQNKSVQPCGFPTLTDFLRRWELRNSLTAAELLTSGSSSVCLPSRLPSRPPNAAAVAALSRSRCPSAASAPPVGLKK